MKQRSDVSIDDQITIPSQRARSLAHLRRGRGGRDGGFGLHPRLALWLSKAELELFVVD
jgi:hypothetical protein